MLSKCATLLESGNTTAPSRASYLLSMVFKICHPKSPGADMPARERPCLEHVQRCPGLLVAFSLSLVSFKIGGHKPETMLRTSAAQAMGTFTPAARVLSWSSGQLRTPENPDNPKPKLSTSAKLGFHFSANIPPAQTGGCQQKTKLRTSAAPGAHPSTRAGQPGGPISTGIFAQQAWLYLMVYLHGGSISDNRKYSRTH